MSPLAQLGQDSCKNLGRSTKRKLASSMSTDCIQPSSGSLLKPNLSPPEKWSKANKKGLLWGIQCWSLTFLKHQYQKKGNCRSHEKTLQQILPFLAKENLHLTAGSGASPCRVGKIGKLTVNSLGEPRKGRGCCYTPSLGTLHQHKMQLLMWLWAPQHQWVTKLPGLYFSTSCTTVPKAKFYSKEWAGVAQWHWFWATETKEVRKAHNSSRCPTFAL